MGAVRRCERVAHLRWVDQIEADVADRKLRPGARSRRLAKPEHLLIELRRSFKVGHRDRNEVDAFHCERLLSTHRPSQCECHAESTAVPRTAAAVSGSPERAVPPREGFRDTTATVSKRLICSG